MRDAAEPELITIVEGPPPEFKSTPDLWPLSIYEGPQSHLLAICQMRTFNGPKMVERCQGAWGEDRPVKLDFADSIGVRRQVSVVAARWSEVPEGHLLHLWLQIPAQPPED
jgi:hypothetical protein